MYVHIGDTVSVLSNPLLLWCTPRAESPIKSPIHHYETLEYIANGTRGAKSRRMWSLMSVFTDLVLVLRL